MPYVTAAKIQLQVPAVKIHCGYHLWVPAHGTCVLAFYTISGTTDPRSSSGHPEFERQNALYKANCERILLSLKQIVGVYSLLLAPEHTYRAFSPRSW